MLRLLGPMLKEEWRMHSSIFGNISFGLFPAFIILVSFLLSMSGKMFSLIFEPRILMAISHYIFFFMGTNVGAFGLVGKEFMNRRFGQASLIAYSSRTLPVNDRQIFLESVLKDIIYYIFMLIIPSVIGFTFASLVLKFDVSLIPRALFSVTLSFLLGLSLTFIFSMIFANSKKIFLFSFASFIVLIAYVSHFNFSTAALGFFPLRFFMYETYMDVIYSFLLIIISFIFSFLIAKFEFPQNKREHSDSYSELYSFMERIGLGKSSKYVAKDFVDIIRSDGGIGKIIFSFFIPISFIWLFLSIFTAHVPQANFLMIFAIFLGIFSASFYTWVTEYDQFNQYLYFPVKVSDIMRSKIISYLILSVVSIATLMIVSILTSSNSYLLLSFIVYAIIALYSLSLTLFLTGLSPSILFFNVKNILIYFIAIIPVMLSFIFLYIVDIRLFWISIVLVLIVSMILFQSAFRKWDSKESSVF